ncbi:hypothetical protein PG910_07020 [Tenacibaculum dicentrarchi]|nr:hypothetical protein PG910_07020 [Tenacibaculum dicentrarchi]
MKAKEYNSKFSELLKTETVEKSIYEIFNKMFLEVKEIQKLRNAKTDSALISIFNEMNIKGNAFVRKANKEHKVMLVNDAFKNFTVARYKDFAKLLGWT